MKKFLATLGVAAVMGTGAANAALVDFSTNSGIALTNGDLVTSFDFGSGLTGDIVVYNGFNSRRVRGEARIIDTDLDQVNGGPRFDPDLGSPFTNTDDATDQQSFGNALIIQERVGVASGTPDDERRGGTITFRFDTPISLTSITLLDGEEGGRVRFPGGTVGAVYGAGIGFDNSFTTLDVVGGDRVNAFTVRLNGSGAIGAFEAAVVPVPAALPLLLAGVGALGMVGRRRRKTA